LIQCCVIRSKDTGKQFVRTAYLNKINPQMIFREHQRNIILFLQLWLR